MSMTYFATDKHGHTYSRHSAGHLKPRYFWAAIFRPEGTTHAVAKANVTYSIRTPADHRYADEVVAVRAYPGRHKVEPVAERSKSVSSPTKTEEQTPVSSEPFKSHIEHVWTPCPTELAYGELRRAYEHFNTTLFNGRLPRCLITFQRKGPSNLGYYSPNRFSGMFDESVKADEIALNPVNFAKRSVTDILSTLVHEMVHLQCQHEGKACRGGYHDKAWGAAMKAIGLYPSNTGEMGGKETGQQMSHYVMDGGPFYVACSMLLRTGFTLSFADRHGMGEGKAKSPKAGRRSKYVCFECQLAAWAKPEAKLMCGDCGIIMDEN
jgi:SprT-like family